LICVTWISSPQHNERRELVRVTKRYREGKVLMMKMLRTMAIVASAIVFASSAQAAWVSDTFTQTLAADGVEMPNFQMTGSTINYDFAVAYTDTTNLQIDSAVLDVVSKGADNGNGNTNELYTVSIGATTRGPLLGHDYDWVPTTFTGLEGLMPTADGPLTVSIAGTLDLGFVVYDSSTLTIGYRYEVPGADPQESGTDPVVPAPSAIILCSLGTGMVGWVRRRLMS
jgi:hypothetical protein